MPPDDRSEPDLLLRQSGQGGLGYRSPARRVTAARLLAAALIVVGIGIAVGIWVRTEAASELANEVGASAIPVVAVIHPKAGAKGEALVIPGDARAYIDTGIYARTNGYVKSWNFDIGAHVKSGQVMAEIETPEIDDQLRQARADLATARATLKLAGITAARNENLLKTRSVSTQERDNAVGGLDTASASVQSHEADVARLEKLQSFEKIYAPFDGVVTARNVEIGMLINAGASGTAQELFHLAATNPLRIYAAVPEVYAGAIQHGAAATVTLDEYPGQSFEGKIVRNAGSIDATSRTLLVEVDVDNSSGKLLPGAYAFVHFTLPVEAQGVTLPANTLLFRAEGLQVGVVRDGKVALTQVKIGHDYGDSVEVVAGVQPTDQIVLSPSDSLIDGMAVRIAGGAEAGPPQ